MKRMLVMGLLLATVAALVASTASAHRSARPAGHIRGIVAPVGFDEAPAGANGNMTWHGGPVMHSSSVYAIYWAPSGYSYQAGYRGAIAKYFTDVATDSGKSSNVYAVNAQYGDGAGTAAIVVVFAGFARGQLVQFQQMGFGVAVALLLDATLIRSVVLPSIASLLGRRTWYLPNWLEWLPHLDVERTPSTDRPATPTQT